jgi:hypothetical protein
MHLRDIVRFSKWAKTDGFYRPILRIGQVLIHLFLTRNLGPNNFEIFERVQGWLILLGANVSLELALVIVRQVPEYLVSGNDFSV